MVCSLRRLHDDLGDAAAAGYVVHGGDRPAPLGDGVAALPLVDL